MRSAAAIRQKRINLACGYALGGYLCVTAAWLAILVIPGLALFCLIGAVVAGFVGTLRALLLGVRFLLIPVTTLIYAPLSFISSLDIALGLGLLYSAATAAPLYLLFKNHFAKRPPPWLCQDCGYPLLGLDRPLCPECGRPFDPGRVPKIIPANATGKST